MRNAFFAAANPGVKGEVEAGGATSGLQSKCLDAVLAPKNSAIDVHLVDIARTARNAAAGW